MYELAAGRTIAHAYVGIQMTTITPDFARQNNIDPNAPNVIPEVLCKFQNATSLATLSVYCMPLYTYVLHILLGPAVAVFRALFSVVHCVLCCH
jgi:hypothetical protein